MTAITPEQRQAIVDAGGKPVWLEDPQNREAYVLLQADAFEKIQRFLAPALGLADDWQTTDAYGAIEEAFREGWEAPGMADYDEYEKHRP